MIGSLVRLAWSGLVGHKIAIAYYGGLAACVAIGAFGFYQWGHNVAGNACEAAALRSEIAALKADRDAANDRALRAAAVIAALNERRSADGATIAKLQDDLSKAKLQSTQEGAKHDPSALLDDQCNYTARGMQRRRMHR